MPIYAFRCRSCGRKRESLRRDLLPCDCGDLYRREYSFSTKPDTPAHFNHSVGSYVTNDRQFRDQLKVKSEEASKQFGIDVNYSPIDPTDRKSLGVTSEGLGETIDRRKDLGMKPLSLPGDI